MKFHNHHHVIIGSTFYDHLPTSTCLMLNESPCLKKNSFDRIIYRQGQSGSKHFCGGTILDEKTIMCAAHCFTQGNVEKDVKYSEKF